jgi:peptidoglycan/xylan/chitin deacetylase (PgdA/CDA1 family)
MTPRDSTGRTVSIVTYHFVRDLEGSRHPGLKARRTSEFVSQVRFISREYNPISGQELAAALADPGVDLPERAILLTFDDGYSDHHRNVAPILADFGMSGTFFVPAMPVLECKVMQVNKIQFMLAATDDDVLLNRVLAEIEQHRGSGRFGSASELWAKYAVPNRFDTASVRFIKQTLQNALPSVVRAQIVDDLFAELVTDDESAFAEELYMSAAEVKSLIASGMEVGGHGYAHQWMDSLSASDQQSEIDLSRTFLESLGCDLDGWSMCYPYGRWDDPLVDLLARSGCRAAYTVEPRIADLDRDPGLLLPRLDTNDLPF